MTPAVLNVGDCCSGKWLLHIVPVGTYSSKMECSATVITCGIRFALALSSETIELEGDPFVRGVCLTKAQVGYSWRVESGECLVHSCHLTSPNYSYSLTGHRSFFTGCTLV